MAPRSGAGSWRRFAQPILIVRWTTTAVALALAALGHVEARAGSIVVWSSLILAITVGRTIRPTRSDSRRRLIEVSAELAIVGSAIVATGAFESPFAIVLIPPIAVAAFGSGLAIAVIAALVAVVAIGMPTLVSSTAARADQRLVVQWATELVLVAVVASFASRVMRDSEEERQRSRQSLERLADANDLLVTLHEITQELPATLDLDDVLESVFTHVRSLVPVNYGGIALRDDAGGDWHFVAHIGPLDPVADADTRLAEIRDHLSTCVVTAVDPGLRLYPNMTDGRYVALRSRGELIGVLVVEHNTSGLYDIRHDEALVLVAESAALAVDNARLFSRLRHLGATEERTRIARDLHDRMGQSLAYMGFELDRIHRGADGTVIEGDIDRLRQYLRTVTGEVRETLYDLRSDVDETRTAAEVLDEFSQRVATRSGLRVTADVEVPTDLSRVRQRELCRITKEALVNAERHSGGTELLITWVITNDGVQASVTDDGRGFQADAGRNDSYGLVGMRERAAAIGADLSISQRPGGGTSVQVFVPNDITHNTRRVAI